MLVAISETLHAAIPIFAARLRLTLLALRPIVLFAARQKPVGKFLHLVPAFLGLLKCRAFLHRARLIRWPMNRCPALLNFPDPAGDILPDLLRLLPFALEALQLLAHKRSLPESTLERMFEAVLLHHPFKLRRAAPWPAPSGKTSSVYSTPERRVSRASAPGAHRASGNGTVGDGGHGAAPAASGQWLRLTVKDRHNLIRSAPNAAKRTAYHRAAGIHDALRHEFLSRNQAARIAPFASATPSMGKALTRLRRTGASNGANRSVLRLESSRRCPS